MEILLHLVFLAAFLTPAHGFCGSRKLNGDLSRAALKAGEWLREQMGENGTFSSGHESALAFHSLRLVGYSVPKVSKHGAEHLKTEIKKPGLHLIPGGRLALYILGVMSLCEDPRDFNKQNLVAALKGKMSSYGTVESFNHPFQLGLALLALCTSDERVEQNNITFLIKKLTLSNEGAHNIDTLSMGIVVLSCIRRKEKRDNRRSQFKLTKAITKTAVEKLLAFQKKNKGTFGTEATTSLAVTALLAAGVKIKRWRCKATMKKLLAMQDEDGSFTNILGTIHTLPVLIGAVHYDVKDLSCPMRESDGVAKNITVCMKLELNASLTSKVSPPAEYFIVKNGTNAHSIMKLASTRHPCYNFTTEHFSFGHSVVSICGVAQKPEEMFYWQIYVDPDRKPSQYGIDHLIPRDGQCLVFVYDKINWK